MKTQIKQGLDINEYHKDDTFISQSRLQLLKTSPHHFINPQPYKQKDSLDFGSAVHFAILEPELFEVEVCAFDTSKRPNPDKDFRNAENKKYKIEFYETHENMIVLDLEIFEVVKDIAKRVHEHPFLKGVFSSGKAETSVFWKDSVTDVQCKSRFDWVRTDGKGFIMDVKCSNTANPKDFSRKIAQYGYHIQAGSQCIAFEEAFKKDVEHYFYLVVESVHPYSFVVLNLPYEDLDLGRFEYRKLLQKLKECRDHDDWPGFEEQSENKQGIVPCGLPSWYKESITLNQNND